jgi:hypothetical protein
MAIVTVKLHPTTAKLAPAWPELQFEWPVHREAPAIKLGSFLSSQDPRIMSPAQLFVFNSQFQSDCFDLVSPQPNILQDNVRHVLTLRVGSQVVTVSSAAASYGYSGEEKEVSPLWVAVDDRTVPIQQEASEAPGRIVVANPVFKLSVSHTNHLGEERVVYEYDVQVEYPPEAGALVSGRVRSSVGLVQRV